MSLAAPHRLAPLIALLLLGACAGHKAATPTSSVQMDAEEIRGNPELARMNDEELLACGEAAAAANEQARAAECFGRIVDLHPESRHAKVAALKAGLALEELQRWELAHERFGPIADPKSSSEPELTAAFRLAETEYHLKRYPEAAAILAVLAGRSDLAPGRKLEAHVQQGICELETGEDEHAEQTLRSALDDYQGFSEPTEDDTRVAAQGQFFLGEIYRLRYAEVALDPNLGAEALSRDLELKAQLLLSAQGHYLRAIKLGNGYWATASGNQIGDLYQDLYQRLLSAPPPKELDEEEAALYSQELRRKVRVLLSKAINVYERTLEAAERIGSSGPFIDRTRESLQRMKDLMVAETRADDESDPAPPAPAARPRS